PLREGLSRCRKSNLCCFRNRITIGSATGRGKRNRLDSIIDGELQRVAIAVCENLSFAAGTAAPNRADSVNDETSGQIVSAGDFSFALSAAPKDSTLREQFWPSSAMDRAIDSTATEQRRIRGVH